jgi:hypothetical protein
MTTTTLSEAALTQRAVDASPVSPAASPEDKGFSGQFLIANTELELRLTYRKLSLLKIPNRKWTWVLRPPWRVAIFHFIYQKCPRREDRSSWLPMPTTTAAQHPSRIDGLNLCSRGTPSQSPTACLPRAPRGAAPPAQAFRFLPSLDTRHLLALRGSILSEGSLVTALQIYRAAIRTPRNALKT